MTSKLKTALRKLGHFEHFLFGTGSWSLKPYERRLIEAVLNELGDPISNKVREQLRRNFFVERANKNIHMLRFYSQNDNLRVGGEEFDDCLYKVAMRVNGRRQTGRVTFYKGYLFSVETPKPEKFYRDAEIEITGIERGRPKDSIAGAIDRLEHGRPEDDV